MYILGYSPKIGCSLYTISIVHGFASLQCCYSTFDQQIYCINSPKFGKMYFVFLQYVHVSSFGMISYFISCDLLIVDETFPYMYMQL